MLMYKLDTSKTGLPCIGLQDNLSIDFEIVLLILFTTFRQSLPNIKSTTVTLAVTNGLFWATKK
jgi:hypothetical protein